MRHKLSPTPFLVALLMSTAFSSVASAGQHALGVLQTSSGMLMVTATIESSITLLVEADDSSDSLAGARRNVVVRFGTESPYRDGPVLTRVRSGSNAPMTVPLRVRIVTTNSGSDDPTVQTTRAALQGREREATLMAASMVTRDSDEYDEAAYYGLNLTPSLRSAHAVSSTVVRVTATSH